MEKRCFRCGIVKELEEFHRHPQMADGHLGKCKVCARQDAKKYGAARYANPQLREHDKEWQRQYSKTPEGREAKAKYRQTPQHKRYQAAYQKARRHGKDNTQYLARAVVGNAIREGRLTRQPCEVCGSKAEAHHSDYSRPLDVRWLCRAHPRAEHNNNASY